jgi:hypothetical protein
MKYYLVHSGSEPVLDRAWVGLRLDMAHFMNTRLLKLFISLMSQFPDKKL